MSFKIIAGDLPIATRLYEVEKDIQRVEILTEENKKKIFGSAGWGLTGAVLGSLIAGPVGLAAGIAGILKGGNKKEICFACFLRDGRKFMAIADNKTYQTILARAFNNT